VDPRCLEPGTIIDADHHAIRAFVARFTRGHVGDRPRAIALYYAVRDGVRYDPYHFDLSEQGMKASETLRAGRGWCVPKAVLLAACCRAAGIPARLGFADVRNHLSTERMRQVMETDVFYWHGFTEIWLDRWVKATPAFNIELCEKFGVLPLDFDGVHDSLYHPYDAKGQRHMEYLRERGSYVDLPLEEISATMRERYPSLFDQLAGIRAGSFDAEVERETAR
jgi:transglutaminase-like putative cysteine protease